MIKSKLLNNLITLVLILSLSTSVLLRVTKLCQLKQAEHTYGGFVDSDEESDVLFLGSSRMINAVFPMLLWRDYGITSYNLGAHANLLPATYWEMENAFAIKKPKMIVLDTYGISNNFKYETPEYLHSWMDAFPLNATKVKAILDLSNDAYKDESIANGYLGAEVKGSVAEFLWTFIKYHSRWDQITEEDINIPPSTEKGAEARIRVESFEDKSEDTTALISEKYVGEEYLRKIIETCQNQGIDVLLTYLPSKSDENHYAQINKSALLAKEYGVDFINLYDNGLIDSKTDYYDAKHVNPLGAKKLTDYIGKYISDNYSIVDKREEEATASEWDKDYKAYVYYMSEKVAVSEEITNALILLGFEDFDSIIEIYNPEIFADDNCNNILTKLSVDTAKAGQICQDTGACIIVSHRGGQEAEVYSINEIPNEYLQLLDEKKKEYDYDTEFFVPSVNTRMTVINRISGEITVKEL